MKTSHKHKFEYHEKSNEEWCVCGETKKHIHKWIIYKIVPFPQSIKKVWEKCHCGKRRNYYECPRGRFDFEQILKQWIMMKN